MNSLTTSIATAYVFEAGGSTSPSGSPPTAVLDLGLLALEPLPTREEDGGAIIGFVRSQFLAEPDNKQGFSIKSTANTLYAVGTGFTTPASGDAPMTADVTNAPATMTVYLKVDDADSDLSLHIKHWKVTPAGCLMTIEINPPPSANGVPANDPITRHIDSFEAGSGTDNVTEVILRRKDYASGDFYDYLQLGLNTITIQIASLDTSKSPAQCVYAIRALAVT